MTYRDSVPVLESRTPFVQCDRCGKPADVTDGEGGWANCAACEEDFQRFMVQEFPFGQCWECGAKGYQHITSDARVEIRFPHIEGGCSRWVDWVGVDGYGDEVLEEMASPLVKRWLKQRDQAVSRMYDTLRAGQAARAAYEAAVRAGLPEAEVARLAVPLVRLRTRWATQRLGVETLNARIRRAA